MEEAEGYKLEIVPPPRAQLLGALGPALRAAFPAAKHDTLAAEVATLLIHLSHVPYRRS